MLAKFIAIILLSYLLGAIPFGLILSRLTKRVDVREYGSGRTGGANVLRTAGAKAGAIVLLCDTGKGAGAVLLAGWIVGSGVMVLGDWELDLQAAQVMAALAAIIGHDWSVYIKFRGGRGVATFFGAWLAMYWPVTFICGVGVVLGVTALTRYFSLGSVLGSVSSFVVILPLVLLGKQPVEYLVYTTVAVPLILFQHRDNIQRLRSGKERKLGERAEKVPSPVKE